MKQQKNQPRQLLIGLDAMEWTLVTRWAKEGKLPTFRRLLAQGAAAPLKTTAEQLPDTVWPALYTGTNPAKFQKFFYVQYDPETMGLKHVPDDANRCLTFWDALSQAGYRVGVVDAPKFRLSDSLNGFQVTNWGAHATKTARTSYPSSLLAEIEARLGQHPVGDCDAVDSHPKALEGLRANVLEGVRLHGKLFQWLMQEQSWDVFFAAFSAPHCIGHHFWHGTDPTHPLYEQAVAQHLADTVEQVYRAIDREIGAMLKLVEPETRVMVFAAHGMGPVHHASWNLPEILGLLGYGSSPARQANSAQPRAARINPWRLLKMSVPGAVQYWIKNRLPQAVQDWLLFRWYAGGQNWKNCRAFAIPNNESAGAIRISVKGRDRYGLVEPGAAYESLCQEIAMALKELIDPVSGRPVIKKITFTQREFNGPYLAQLPDLTVLWDQSFHWDTIYSARLGTLKIRQQDSRTGSHTPVGFVIMAGPGIPAGKQLASGSIYDIAPTVLATAGVDLPPNLDGQPLQPQREAVLV
jgi:predicted AlkP superfamily phosphohydrolase/phosphomutase